MDREGYDEIRNAARNAAESLRGCSVRLSPFLDGWGVSIYISELKASGDIQWVDSGGLPGVSRRVVAFTCGKSLGIDAIPFIYPGQSNGSILMRTFLPQH